MSILEKNTDENTIYISQFGSFETSEWIKGVSDIDIGVIVKSMEGLDFSLEYKLEDYFKGVYNYDNINITVVEFNMENQLVRNIVCGKTLYSLIDEEELKYEAIYLTKISEKQREYYNDLILEKAKDDLDVW